MNRQQLAAQSSSLLMISTSSIRNEPKEPKQNIMLKVGKEVVEKHENPQTLIEDLISIHIQKLDLINLSVYRSLIA